MNSNCFSTPASWSTRGSMGDNSDRRGALAADITSGWTLGRFATRSLNCQRKRPNQGDAAVIISLTHYGNEATYQGRRQGSASYTAASELLPVAFWQTASSRFGRFSYYSLWRVS